MLAAIAPIARRTLQAPLIFIHGSSGARVQNKNRSFDFDSRILNPPNMPIKRILNCYGRWAGRNSRNYQLSRITWNVLINLHPQHNIHYSRVGGVLIWCRIGRFPLARVWHSYCALASAAGRKGRRIVYERIYPVARARGRDRPAHLHVKSSSRRFRPPVRPHRLRNGRNAASEAALLCEPTTYASSPS